MRGQRGDRSRLADPSADPPGAASRVSRSAALGVDVGASPPFRARPLRGAEQSPSPSSVSTASRPAQKSCRGPARTPRGSPRRTRRTPRAVPASTARSASQISSPSGSRAPGRWVAVSRTSRATSFSPPAPARRGSSSRSGQPGRRLLVGQLTGRDRVHGVVEPGGQSHQEQVVVVGELVDLAQHRGEMVRTCGSAGAARRSVSAGLRPMSV